MRIFAFLVAVLVAAATPASAGEWNLFRFEDFPASAQRVQKAPLQLVRGEFSWQFRTRVREAYDGHPDFAGRYITGSAGCGTECQINFMIDAKTGKVIVAPTSSAGVDFRMNSNLWIVNPYPESEEDAYSVDPVSYYYLWNGKDFIELGQKEWPEPAVTGSITPAPETPTYGNPFDGQSRRSASTQKPLSTEEIAETVYPLPATARVPTARPLS